MKKMKLIIALLMLTLVACAQPDKTFKELTTFEKGIKFGDGTIQTTAGGSASTSWEAITGKPLTFPAAVHNHDGSYKPISYVPSYNELTDKPAEIDLNEAIPQLSGIRLPVMTTAEITALTPSQGLLVYDSDLNVLKIYAGGVWKIIITAN